MYKFDKPKHQRMKNFIKNGLVIIILLIVTSSILTLVSNTDEGISLLIIALFFLIIIYFPVIAIEKIRHKENNTLEWLNYIGLTGISIGVTALIFRMFHWPGGSIIGVVGTFIFTVNYLPFWLYYQWKTKSTIDKYFYLIFCIALGLLLAHYLFKTQHWPWATKMGYLSTVCFITLLIYYVVVKTLLKNPSFSPSVKQQFIFGFMLAYVLSGIQNNVITYGALNSVSTGYENAEKNSKAFATKNKFIYDAFTKTIGADSTSNQYYLNSKKT